MYAQQRGLLHEDVWKEYYTPAFLLEETTAQFYRLPDLQDLPDTTGDMNRPRQKGVGHFSKLPRWAHLVVKTHRKKPDFPVATLTEIATTTLRQSIARLREDNPAARIQLYSETQAYFWLKKLGLFSSYRPSDKWLWDPDWPFGAEVAVGEKDLWAWEAHYSPELWASPAAEVTRLDPDLDGTRKSDVTGCSWPDGYGLVAEAWNSGWDPEVGSTEEVAFLAGIAVKETEELLADATRTPDCAVRSHIPLGTLRAAFEADLEREESIARLSKAVVEAGRLDDEAAAREWIRRALKIAEKYAHELGNVRPASAEVWAGVFKKMLEENGQLFWQWSPRKGERRGLRDFTFRLKPAVKIPG